MAFADGRHFDITAVPLPDGNALMTMLDTTDHHRAERALRDRNEALEAADRVKTAFVANMSYELRTPLTSIKGFTELLHGGYAGEMTSSGVEYTEAILASVDRLGNLIDDVLDLTQSDGAPLMEALHAYCGYRLKPDPAGRSTLARGLKRAQEAAQDASVKQAVAQVVRQAAALGVQPAE